MLPSPSHGFVLSRTIRTSDAKPTLVLGQGWSHPDGTQLVYLVERFQCACHTGRFALSVGMCDAAGRAIEELPAWVRELFVLDGAKRRTSRDQQGGLLVGWSREIVPVTVGEC